jgi:hypothetical protein
VPCENSRARHGSRPALPTATTARLKDEQHARKASLKASLKYRRLGRGARDYPRSYRGRSDEGYLISIATYFPYTIHCHLFQFLQSFTFGSLPCLSDTPRRQASCGSTSIVHLHQDLRFAVRNLQYAKTKYLLKYGVEVSGKNWLHYRHDVKATPSPTTRRSGKEKKGGGLEYQEY